MWGQRSLVVLRLVIFSLFYLSRVPPAQEQLPLSSLLASDGCVKSGGGVFLGLSIYKLEPKSGVGGGLPVELEDRSAAVLPTAGASHRALHALSNNSLRPWVWRQISHTLANSNKFSVNSPLSQFSYLYSFS